MNEECKHEWLVLLEAKTCSWSELCSYRGEDITKEPYIVRYRLTHTLICTHCQEIKMVK